MTLRYRALDENGDMTFGRGRVNFHIDNPAAVAQAIKTRLGLWTGEWFLDLADGTDWQQVVGQVGRINVRDAIIRERVQTTPQVLMIYDWASVVENRIYKASARVITTFGQFGVQITGQPGATPDVDLIGWGGFPIALG